MTTQRAIQLVEAGAWLLATGDREGARQLFEQALRLDPTNSRAKQLLSGTEAAGLAEASAQGPVPIAQLGPTAPSPVGPAHPSIAPAPAGPVTLRAVAFPQKVGGQKSPAARTEPRAPGSSDRPSPQPAHAASAPASSPGRAPPLAVVRPGSARPPMPGFKGLLDPPVAPLKSPRPQRPEPPAARPPPPIIAPPAESAWDTPDQPGVNLGPTKPESNDPFQLLIDEPLAAEASATTAPPPAPSNRDEVDALLRGAKDLLGLDDHSGAMDLILKAEKIAPKDPGVLELRAKSEQILEAMLESKLGGLHKVPRVVLKDDEVIWLNLDHRAGFVLAQIDGTMTFDDVFSVSGMSRLDTARILVQLLDEGVIKS